EQQRTRLFCKRVVELELLKEMQADATLPKGEKLKVEGFLTIDEEKLTTLPDATVLELHRSGMLMLMQSHLMSLINVRHLVERKAVRMAAAPAAQ
ncbi:MAG TPA: SapC family protein, partial [Albitalea sp.]|nr:SapC family protein [Albitalea sp.]